MIDSVEKLLDHIQKGYAPAAVSDKETIDMSVTDIMELADEMGVDVTIGSRQEIAEGMERRGYQLYPMGGKVGFAFKVKLKVAVEPKDENA